MLSNEDRALAADEAVASGLAAGTSLPKIRAAFAAVAGENPRDVLGFVDPRYYRALGLSNPLPAPPAATPYAKKDGTPSASLARAVRVRRDSAKGTSLARWDTLRATVEATVGVRPSDTELRALYARGGGDLETSYAGRGTKIAVPAIRDEEGAGDSARAA